MEQITPWKMFLTFARVGLSGFGGVMPFIYREVVEKKHWLNEEDFAELISLGQLLPGANVTNFAAMFGYRVAGWRGVLAAISGLLGPPALVIYGLYQLYQSASHILYFQGALRGITAVACALILTTGFKMARSQQKNISALTFGVLAVLGVAAFRFPLLLVLAALAPISFFIQWRKLK